MNLKVKEFKDIAAKILLAVNLDANAANLELVAKSDILYLNVTNKEFFVSVRYQLDEATDFRTTVEAKPFLTLVSSLTTDTFSLETKDNHVAIKAGKSSYKLPMIYENDQLMTLPRIVIQNKTVEMTISHDILDSILKVNSKELQKAKNSVNVSELQKLYYIDETGCFTFTTGACLNSFTLEKPVKLLLNERIVKLFELFSSDIAFTLGQDQLPDKTLRTKISLEADNVSVTAIINCDDLLLSKVAGPCAASKRFIQENYDHSLVLSVNAFSAAVGRLLNLTKTTIDKANMSFVPATIYFNQEDLIIKDNAGNSEGIQIENGSFVNIDYEMKVNLADIKLILDSCKNEHITLNCGNHRSIVISRGNISNLIPELKPDLR